MDYDPAAAAIYDVRYELHDYPAIGQALVAFLGEGRPAVVEVGCGTGHWLARLAGRAGLAIGLDVSAPMLARARAAAPAARFVRAIGESLPFCGQTFDRVMAVNALHHLADRDAFFADVRRVLRPGGGLAVVSLDPHADRDQWWVYDYFEGTAELNRRRFAPTRGLRGEIATAGFAWCESFEAERVELRLPAVEAMRRGLVSRESSSTLALIPEEAFARGVERLERAIAEHGAEDGDLELVTDLRFYATVGWV